MGLNQDQFFKIVEWMFFIGMCGISLFFMIWGDVLTKFFSEDTSFKVYKEQITERPSITLCFKHANFSPSEYVIHEDFEITYEDIELRLGQRYSQKYHEIVYVSDMKTAYSGRCYIINTVTKEVKKGDFRYITVKFHDETKSAPQMQVYFTSRANAFGILANMWVEGEVWEVAINKNTYKRIALTPEKYVYLQDKSKSECDTVSFYECFINEIWKNKFKGCPKRCSPIPIPKHHEFEVCKQEVESTCAFHVIHNLFGNVTATGKCKKSCTTIQYSGKVLYEKLWEENGMKLSYRYAPPEDTTVFEEYLVYDAIGVIGAVGGTLGMCIGFSFTNLTHVIIICVQRILNYLYEKTTSERKLSRQNIIDKRDKDFDVSSVEDRMSKIEAKLEMLEKVTLTRETHFL